MTRRICSGSSRTSGTPGANRCSMRTSVKMPLYSASVSVMSCARSVGTVRGDGIRANCENSSTSPFSDSTSPTIVCVHSSTSARCLRRGAGEMAAQPLGRQLNRRQRILDLVRQPPRHLAPRGHLLRADERRHVVEHEDDAFGRAAVADQRRRDGGEMQLLPFARQRDLLRRRLRLAARGVGEQRAERLQVGAIEHRARRLADDLPVRG